MGKKLLLCGTCLLVYSTGNVALAQDDILIIESDEEETLIIDDDTTETLIINDDQDTDRPTEQHSTADNKLPDRASSQQSAPQRAQSDTSFAIDTLWLELGHFPKSDAQIDHQGYFQMSVNMSHSKDRWLFQATIDLNAFSEHGVSDWDQTELDYDEVYVRYSGEQFNVTLGTQKILWGKIDEFPPTDRLSTQDYRRPYDDLEDRRLASLALRYQHFFKSSSLDIAIYPKFREAQLPDQNSSWFPVSRDSGEILGLELPDAIAPLLQSTVIKESPPDSDGGFGIRYNQLGTFDYSLSVQYGRQSTPYFSFDPVSSTVTGYYPRTWIVGADAAMEIGNGTLKLESAWLGEQPFTREDGQLDTSEALSWGIAYEMFPGDGDARINLQLTGQSLLGSDKALDRDEIVSLNGSFETPFADHQWNIRTRFSVGLDKDDNYFNPELTYTGVESQEFYLELHMFNGEVSTPGSLYEDNSFVAFGWRGSF